MGKVGAVGGVWRVGVYTSSLWVDKIAGGRMLRMMWRRRVFPYFGFGGGEYYCRSHNKKSCDFAIFVVRRQNLLPKVLSPQVAFVKKWRLAGF